MEKEKKMRDGEDGSKNTQKNKEINLMKGK